MAADSASGDIEPKVIGPRGTWGLLDKFCLGALPSPAFPPVPPVLSFFSFPPSLPTHSNSPVREAENFF